MATFTGTSTADSITPSGISAGVVVSPPGSTLSGDDTLLGLEGDDVLDGGAGNDVIDGGSGADAMTGGTGDDRFLVDDSGDQVFENAGTSFSEADGDTTIDFGGSGALVVLQGVAAADLTEDDFIFA